MDGSIFAFILVLKIATDGHSGRMVYHPNTRVGLSLAQTDYANVNLLYHADRMSHGRLHRRYHQSNAVDSDSDWTDSYRFAVQAPLNGNLFMHCPVSLGEDFQVI